MWLATVSMRPIPRGTVMLLASRTRACCAAALVLTTVTAPAPAAAQQRSFTIEQALSAPFPDELVAAPAGGPLADSAKPEQLVHARGSAQSLHWSPDGTKLAFVSGRGDHGFVGVYDVATKALKFLDASVDDDGEPVWSPDGAQLAFIRIPAAERTLPFTPRRVALPWSIRVADLATGRGREVWKADT